MKPYLAILVDSFWEAVGNKVLWALLIGWSLVLLGLAPFGYITERSFKLSSVDIDNRSELVESLARAAQGKGSDAAKAVGRQLDPVFVDRLSKVTDEEESGGQRRISASELAQELNKVLSSRELYAEEDFPTAKRRKRLVGFIETPAEARTPAELEELNRELMQLAFPLLLNRPQGEQLWIGYAGFKIADPLPFSRREVRQFFEPQILQTIIKLGLGIVAVFIAILVTSPMIPDAFRSGALHLLLSKPISRVWLFLAKFVGGCAFALINITFVLIGLYLIAGLRFEMWNHGLLLCIPLLMFVFIIFYSVSALAGLLWHNAIVSVVTCMLFWLFCFAIGFMYQIMRPQVEVLPQISRVRIIEDHVMAVNEKGELGVWNDKFSVWQPALQAEVRGQARTFGPIYDKSRQLIITKSFFRVPFGGLQARTRKLSLIRLQDDTDAAPADDQDAPTSASEARETPRWMSDPGPELPQQVFDIVELGDTLLAVCRGGLYRLDLDKLDAAESSQKGLFGIKIPWILSAFDNIAPPDYFLSGNSHAAPTQDGQGLILFSSGTLDHLTLEDGKLTIQNSTKLDGDGTEAALVLMNDNYCVVARDGLPITILDSTLQILGEVSLPADQKVRQLSWIPETDDAAIITHTGEFYRIDCNQRTAIEFPIPQSGRCTCMTWYANSEVWLGMEPNQVVQVDIKSGAVKQSFAPTSTLVERIYRWGVQPVYIINPKPAALDDAMAYMLSGNNTQSLGIVTNDLEAAQLELDVWTPIVSNLIFVFVVLGIACVYVSRKEF